jgi:hypothetical protein
MMSKNTTVPMQLEQPMKRTLAALLGLLPWLPACYAMGSGGGADLKHRFRGIQGVTVTTSSTNRHERVTIATDSGKYIAAPSLISSRGGGVFFFGGDTLPIPKAVRITWREGDAKYTGNGGEPWVGGTIIGDYTIEVASRIPDEVLDTVRKDGGSLRIKFRLADEGVLFGWDIDRGRQAKEQYVMAGGDFREAEIYNGKVVRKGWYIHPKTKERIETDF